MLLALVVGFLLKKKNAPDSDFGSRSPAQSPLSNLVDSLCGGWVSGWYTGYGGCCFFLLVVKPSVDILLGLFSANGFTRLSSGVCVVGFLAARVLLKPIKS